MGGAVGVYTLDEMTLGYFAFAWFDDLTDRGHFWVSRLRATTSYRRLHTLYVGAGVLVAIVWLGAWRADRAAHAVRLVSYTHATGYTSPAYGAPFRRSLTRLSRSG